VYPDFDFKSSGVLEFGFHSLLLSSSVSLTTSHFQTACTISQSLSLFSVLAVIDVFPKFYLLVRFIVFSYRFSTQFHTAIVTLFKSSSKPLTTSISLMGCIRLTSQEIFQADDVFNQTDLTSVYALIKVKTQETNNNL
jgi:hypothetical protein